METRIRPHHPAPKLHRIELSPGMVDTINVTFDTIYPFTVEQGDAARFIGTHLAYPKAHHWQPVSGVAFWTGQQSYQRWDLNPVAGAICVELVRAVATGRYEAGLLERAAASMNQVASPVFYGSCLITGMNEADEVVPLPDRFWSWWERFAPDLRRIVLAQHIADTLARKDVAVDNVTDVVVHSD
ncbi:hypothetical protein V5P93_000442 [Actinokineospora auranticolor]|uniref:Uncharacterized protein n=1 Tax=Actinokineospora auranticolor TaxID=155976 RepID=A0A2S6GE44_9PSEU|nr:hypothetical protein [Actinokineospora auranticolor]PPK63504.1 hypothetical protein CLV40_12731 [Actinokineospora auranticolor]